MNPRVNSVKALNHHELELHFRTGEVRIFDMAPYFDKGDFSELKDAGLFNSVRAFNGTVVWDNDLDMCPDTLYLESKQVVAAR
jgi:hypothetical protein